MDKDIEIWDTKTLTIKLKNVCSSVNSLKTLYKPVYGLVIFFVIGGFILDGIRDDAKGAIAAVETNRDKHLEDIKEINKGLREDLKEIKKSIKDELKELNLDLNAALLTVSKEIGKNEISHASLFLKLDSIERRLNENSKRHKQ